MNKRIRIFSKQILTLTLALLMVLLMALIVIRASYLGGIARFREITENLMKAKRVRHKLSLMRMGEDTPE